MHRKIILWLVFGIFFISTNAFASIQYPFKGEIDFVSREAKIDFDLGDETIFNVKIWKKENNALGVILEIEEFKSPFFDISTEIDGNIEYLSSAKQGTRLLKGNLTSQYTLVNKKPIRELSGQFRIQNNLLYLDAVSFGNLTCNGRLDLEYPFEHELSLILTSVSIDEFLNFWVVNKNFAADGLLSGEIKAKGNVNRLTLRGNFDSYAGFIKDLLFDNLHLSIEGVYPKMIIANSVLSKAGGLSYTFQGPFDLSKRKQFKKQIKEMNISPLIESSGADLEWTIKRVQNEDSSSIELKYMRDNKKKAGAETGDERGMLGVEHILKF